MRLWTWPFRAWKAAQVELHGQYSVERLHRVHAFCRRTSVAHSVLVLLLTPLPCLVVTLLIECIPLDNPLAGIEYSLPFWARAFLVTQIVDFLVLHQCRYLISKLPTSNALMLASSCIAAAGAVMSAYGLARVIGFPLPFTLLLGSPVSAALLGACVFAMWGRFFRNNPGERKDLLKYIIVVSVQVTMTYVYPAYAFAFVRLSSAQQIAFALLLPLIKLGVKNWISYLFRDKHDLKSDMVVLNADVYHSLFVSWCMNGTTSTLSTAILMLMDSIEGLLALEDVKRLLNELLPILFRASPVNLHSFSASTGPHLLDIAVAIWEKDKLKVNPLVRKRSHIQPPTRWHSSSVFITNANDTQTRCSSECAKGFAVVFPASSNATDRILLSDPVNAELQAPQFSAIGMKNTPESRAQLVAEMMSETERMQCLQLVLRLLHLAEFLLLIEFVEVVIPSVYCVYLLSIFYLPNRQFFETIRDLNADELYSNLTNVAVYSLLEAGSFVALSYILQRKLGLSTPKLLAFVLDSQWHLAQSKLVLWVIFSVQSRLHHFGTDFSFQFAWLSEDGK